ncbi:hypothetical protein BD626DRAFT_417145 [Schizophyllum amplum]|uniref:EthD domain-containing protein n=1 Tax=Schizophyllum amplum TaxID=97359 RepID=A0A550BSF7_9AGAR|nr:hypothetical protein BD626DRAFT_417145 [Auriculariopsis ampla]
MTVDLPAGLLLVFGELGANVSEDEFSDWLDNEHVPARLTIPGINTALRYIAADGKEPKFASVYDVNSPAVLDSDEYKNLFPGASANEKDIISRLASLQRRVYTLVSTLQHPDTADKPEALPGKYALLAFWEPAPEDEVEFNKWYDEEHFPLLAKVPGYLRARRFKLNAVNDVAPSATTPTDLPAYMAYYEWDNPNYVGTDEMKAANSTDWATKITAKTRPNPPDVRILQLLKKF